MEAFDQLIQYTEKLSEQFNKLLNGLYQLKDILIPNKRESYVWIYTFQVNAANTNTRFETKLPTTHNRLLGITFKSENEQIQAAINTGKIGDVPLEFDRHPILARGVPLIITQAQEVCEECKFFRVCYDNVKDVTVSGSVILTNTTITYPATVAVLFHLDNPDYSAIEKPFC